MKKIFYIIFLCITTFVFAGCNSSSFEDLSLNVPKINVSSNSMNEDGKLYTIIAANKSSNNPVGENKSPHLSWDAVENAVCYAVVMFDISANWLHMFVTEIKTTEIDEGQITNYVGPYPPKNSGIHEYRLEVFALKEETHNLVFTNDKNQNYKDIVKALNRKNAEDGNVLARGYIIGTYANGDNTVR